MSWYCTCCVWYSKWSRCYHHFLDKETQTRIFQWLGHRKNLNCSVLVCRHLHEMQIIWNHFELSTLHESLNMRPYTEYLSLVNRLPSLILKCINHIIVGAEKCHQIPAPTFESRVWEQRRAGNKETFYPCARLHKHHSGSELPHSYCVPLWV